MEAIKSKLLSNIKDRGIRKLIKDDDLFTAIYYIVKTNKAGVVVSNEIKKLRSQYVLEDACDGGPMLKSEVDLIFKTKKFVADVRVAMYFYSIIKTTIYKNNTKNSSTSYGRYTHKVEAFDEEKGDYINYISVILRSIVLDSIEEESRFIHEGEQLAPNYEILDTGECRSKYNTSKVATIIQSDAKLYLDDLVSDEINISDEVILADVVDKLRADYGDDLIDLIVVGCKLTEIANKLGINYTTLISRLRSKKDKNMIKLLKESNMFNSNSVNYTHKVVKNDESCIDCGLWVGDEYFDGEVVMFYDGDSNRGSQHRYRCSLCERYYVDQFIKKYPGTKTLGYKHTPLSEYETEKVIYHQKLSGKIKTDPRVYDILPPNKEDFDE